MIGWLRLGAAAKYASVSRDTFRAWTEDGLKVYQVDGVKLVRPADIDEFIMNHDSGSSVIDSVVSELTVRRK